METEEILRNLSIAFSLITAGIHLALSFFNLIPGENTTGPAFAVIGVGYIIGTVGITQRNDLFHKLVVLYTLALISAYAASRDTLPIEPIGLLTKIDEALLVISLSQLVRLESKRHKPRGP